MGVKISDLIPRPVAIPTGAGSFNVRALGLKEIVNVIAEHREGMKLLFEGGISPEKMPTVIEEAPAMVRDLIALAAEVDDPEEREAILLLPGPVQVHALIEIWRLTVPQPKKLLELLVAIRQQVEQPNLVANQNPVPPSES